MGPGFSRLGNREVKVKALVVVWFGEFVAEDSIPVTGLRRRNSAFIPDIGESCCSYNSNLN